MELYRIGSVSITIVFACLASLINVVKCLQPPSALVCTIQKRALHLSADLGRISQKIGYPIIYRFNFD